MTLQLDNNYIYKYVPFSINTLKSLIKGEIWFGFPYNLNDPFEGEFILNAVNVLPDDSFLIDFYQDDLELPKSMVNGRIEDIKKDISLFNDDLSSFLKKTIKEEYGIACFSKTPKSILMWSHYADSHKGLCLIFDKTKLFSSLKRIQPAIQISEIDYQAKLPNATVELNVSGINILMEQEVFLRKLNDWKKEMEIRMYFHSKIKGIRRSIPFDRACLKGIVFGENIDEDNKLTITHLINSDKRYNVFWGNAKKNLKKRIMELEQYHFVIAGN